MNSFQAFEALMKSIGLKVDPSMCGSRGSYFITSYVFRVAHERKGWRGRLEEHGDSNFGGKNRHYELRGRIRTPEGVLHNFELTSNNHEELYKQVQAEFRKLKLID